MVGHDAEGGGEDDDTELTRREQVGGPLLDAVNTSVEARGNHTALVDAADEVDNNLSTTVVVHNLKVTNVLVLLHDGEELDQDLGTGAEQDLPLSTLLRVVDGLKRIGEDTHLRHGCWMWRGGGRGV